MKLSLHTNCDYNDLNPKCIFALVYSSLLLYYPCVRIRKCERTSARCVLNCCSLMTFFEQYDEFDPFTRSPEPSNPWISDSTEYWEQEQNMLVATRALSLFSAVFYCHRVTVCCTSIMTKKAWVHDMSRSAVHNILIQMCRFLLIIQTSSLNIYTTFGFCSVN